MNNFEYTIKYFPQMWNKGYVFVSNIDKKSDFITLKKRKQCNINKNLCHEGQHFTISKNIIVKGFRAKTRNGTISSSMWPMFGKIVWKNAN